MWSCFSSSRSTRNHDSVIIEDDKGQSITLYHILGRGSRYIQSTNLITGETRLERTKDEFDPAGRPLDDLNHVAGVLVDAVEEGKEILGKKEIWLPCGFHGDHVDGEISSDYARIVNIDNMRVRYGPKLPHSGGACTAAALRIIPQEPPMICSFAGTSGR